MTYKQGAKSLGVYLIIGLTFFILDAGVGAAILLFADRIPFGDFGKGVLLVATIVINGFLVVLVASYERFIKGAVNKVPL